MTDFKELLNTRRAIRDYEGRPVATDLVTEIIQDAVLAPSAGNGQSWRFIIVNNREMIRRLSDDAKKHMLEMIDQDSGSPLARYENILRLDEFNIFYNAPCLVLIGGSAKAHSLSADCSLAAAYLMFSAADRGLGTCWIGQGVFIRSPELLEEIGLSGNFRLVAPITLGYPKAVPGIPERKPPNIIKAVE